MKTTVITLITAAAVLGLSACDQQARESAAQAAEKAKAEAEAAVAKAKEATADAAAKAESSLPDLKAKAAGAMEAAKTAGNDALAKGGELLGTAKEWGLEKMGVPEADGLLDGFKTLIEEAKVAIQGGMTGEKATALKAKWDELYAKSADTIKNLAPEKQEKLKAILATVKAKWDEMMQKAEGGAVQ
jgi:hypothetical protein